MHKFSLFNCWLIIGYGFVERGAIVCSACVLNGNHTRTICLTDNSFAKYKTKKENKHQNSGHIGIRFIHMNGRAPKTIINGTVCLVHAINVENCPQHAAKQYDDIWYPVRGAWWFEAQL